jgi:hypothetical protein
MLAFVPVVVSTPSPRAEALGQRLAETIEQYRQQNPDLSALEVRQAARIAVTRAAGVQTAVPVLAAVAAVAAVAGLMVALAAGPRSAGSQQWILMLPIAGLAIAVALVAALRRR